jgi:hypothetical protein
MRTERPDELPPRQHRSLADRRYANPTLTLAALGLRAAESIHRAVS